MHARPRERPRGPCRPPGPRAPSDMRAIRAKPRRRPTRARGGAPRARRARAPRRAVDRRRRRSRRRRPGSGGSYTPTPSGRPQDRRAAPSPTADGCGPGGASSSPRSSPGTRAHHRATGASRDGRVLRSQSADRSPTRARKAPRYEARRASAGSAATGPGAVRGARAPSRSPASHRREAARTKALRQCASRRCHRPARAPGT